MKQITTVKVNMDKVDPQWIVKGKNGKWLDLILIPTPNNVYGYGNMVVQAVTKQAREEGKRGPIVGNTKLIISEKRSVPINNGA